MPFIQIIRSSLSVSGIAAALCFSACTNSSKTNEQTVTDSTTITTDTAAAMPVNLTPTNPKPAWGKDLTDPMAVILEKLVSYKDKPLTTLSAIEARKQHSPADAVMDVMKEKNITAPASNVDTMGKNIPVAGGNIHLRIYTPKTGRDSYPVIVYYHGGGWVISTLDSYGASAESLANLVDAVVVSVAYRQAPEMKFPTAHNDSYAAYAWTVTNAASIKGDPKRIAVVGESAGGNLATAVSMMARDKGIQLPVHEVLVYPIAGYDFNTTSYKESDSIIPLSAGLMKWFYEKYLNSAADGKNPMISLVTANLKGLPPTTIIAAQYDPLRTEGELLADNLKKAGVTTDYKLYKGVTHEFFGMGAVLPEARDAQAFAASALKNAFSK